MSRKTLMSFLAVAGVALTFLKDQFGLAIDPTAILAGVGAILIYVFLEAKNDIQKMAKQPGKWKDPKFWITFASVVLAAVNQNFGLGIPVEAIVSVLTIVVGILFKVDLKKPIYA